MTGPELGLAACRFLHAAALMLLWGAFGFIAALVPQPLAGELGQRLRAFRIAAVVVALATTVAALPLAAATIGDGWADAADGDTLRVVLFETSVGWAWRVQAAAAVILAVTQFRPPRFLTGATAAAAGLLLAGTALAGHAVMQEGRLGIAHGANDALHVLAGGAWLGALVPLSRILGRLTDPSCCGAAGIALRRFSAAGHVAVALVVATGVANTALVLGRLPTDWASPYQAMLAAKVLLVAAMIALALLNRYRLAPRMAWDRPGAARAIRRITQIELLLGLAVVALVALFGLLDPG